MNLKLLSIFVRESNNVSNPDIRQKCAGTASIIGIVSNLLLSVLKLFVGIISKSISITADAVNNLTDAASSVITLIGFRLSGKPADKEHPYGHRRMEYVTGLIVSMVITILGVQFFINSFENILHPTETIYTTASIIILAVSIIVKLWQSRFYVSVGRHIGSTTLIAASSDSRNDVLATAAVLIGAVISKYARINLDGWLGCAVALFIIWSGISLIIETSNPLLGEAPSPELVKQIGEKILSYESILGYHDLVVHDYGPDRRFASVHVEVPAEQDILKSHDIIDNIENDFLREMGLHVVIHLDPVVTNDPELDRMHEKLTEILKQVSDEVELKLTMHDFRMVRGKTHTNLLFDITIPVDCAVSDKALRDLIEMRVHEELGETYCPVITCDRNYISTTD